MRRRVLQVQNAVLHHLAVPGLILLIGIGSALAQSGDLRAQDQSTKAPAANTAPSADAAKETQRKTDEFVEASQAINGPAGNPECVWLGRRASAKSRICAISGVHAAALLQRDKVVTLLDKIRNTRHGKRSASPPHWGPICPASNQRSRGGKRNRRIHASTGTPG